MTRRVLFDLTSPGGCRLTRCQLLLPDDVSQEEVLVKLEEYRANVGLELISVEDVNEGKSI